MKYLSLFLFLLSIPVLQTNAQVPPSMQNTLGNTIYKDEISRYYITPKRIVWMTDSTNQKITNPQILLLRGDGQTSFGIDKSQVCQLKTGESDTTGIILDFGIELNGGIQITTATSNRVTPLVRIRFGESVSETMSTVIGDGTTGEQGGATNHHAMRDFEIRLPGYGTLEVGNSGFRFVRIDLVEPNARVAIEEIRAVAKIRDMEYKGSFRCNDSLFNQIWLTGAYTVHLNMQDYLWDGIKRDRMVWIGDMHPEVMTINTVFGYQDIVPKSLDYVRDHTPLPKWMNGISSYSMWWIIMQYDWYMYHGNKSYLQEQKNYLTGLLQLLMTKVDKKGNEQLDGMRFLDWPSNGNEKGVHAGLQGLMILAFNRGAILCNTLGEENLAKECEEMVIKMKAGIPDINNSKQAAALLALSDAVPAENANNDVIAKDGVKDFSTFYGYYMLQAQAKAGDYQTAIDNIRLFWGAMLKLGATTFWEGFNLDWIENAAGITEIVPEGKKDIHRDFGDYCYKGLRLSLCHGWSSGPTSWLTEHVLGIEVVEPGCKTIRIEPHLGDLQWAEGTFPTPYGIVSVRHEKKEDGTIQTKVDTPNEVKIIQ
ncbi:MAG: alpha-L-rhamnosidase [Bacteroidales bacterium]|nr:alpha-L-rhamnosidase [Bacteroidales bacterium]